jgi:hypothetical protein
VTGSLELQVCNHTVAGISENAMQIGNGHMEEPMHGGDRSDRQSLLCRRFKTARPLHRAAPPPPVGPHCRYAAPRQPLGFSGQRQSLRRGAEATEHMYQTTSTIPLHKQSTVGLDSHGQLPVAGQTCGGRRWRLVSARAPSATASRIDSLIHQPQRHHRGSDGSKGMGATMDADGSQEHIFRRWLQWHSPDDASMILVAGWERSPRHRTLGRGAKMKRRQGGEGQEETCTICLMHSIAVLPDSTKRWSSDEIWPSKTKTMDKRWQNLKEQKRDQN